MFAVIVTILQWYNGNFVQPVKDTRFSRVTRKLRPPEEAMGKGH